LPAKSGQSENLSFHLHQASDRLQEADAEAEADAGAGAGRQWTKAGLHSTCTDCPAFVALFTSGEAAVTALGNCPR